MKLADLDPKDVATQAVAALVGHIGQATFALGPFVSAVSLPRPEQYAQTDLGLTVQTLTEYAQKGLPVWDWDEHGMAADGLLTAITALYGSALGDLGSTAIDVVDELDPDHPVDLVLVATAARVRLSRQTSVTPREVGALAGIGAAGVRRYIRSGELPAEGKHARIRSADARRWLASRGVAGID